MTPFEKQYERDTDPIGWFEARYVKPLGIYLVREDQ